MVRELARCYQAFESLSAAHVRFLGLTPAQFDIIATLGDTPGMNFRELGEKTLITKGTLTGVIHRLQARGLVSCERSLTDRRSHIVTLTAQGEALFRQVFPAHLDYLRGAFATMSVAELTQTETTLRHLRAVLQGGRNVKGATKTRRTPARVPARLP